MQTALAPSQSSNFSLKQQTVALRPTVRRAVSDISITDLEAFRTGGTAVSASKHSLETLCGASCETGAQ
jgi:hypothetical protein